MDGARLSDTRTSLVRLRWRRAGAWLWPSFVVFTLADAIIGHELPPAGSTESLFAAGLRPPYSRTLDVILGFLRDITEPFLRIFRRVIPALGGFDFSPILAILTLAIFTSIVVQGIIHG